MKILALDLGKFKTIGCLLDTELNKTRYSTIKTVPFSIFNLLEHLEPDCLVMEVGTPAGWVCDIARSAGIEVQVANVNHDAWRWRNVKRKTDRLDALKLAQLSSVGQLPLVHIPDQPTRQHRSLIRYRSKLIERRTGIKNTIRSILHRQGFKMPSGARGWTLRSLERLWSMARKVDSLEMDQLWRGELYEELSALDVIEQQIERIEHKLDSLCKQDERIVRLQSIPCVGPRTAEMLVAVIDDPGRFRSGKQLGSYLGLVPRQYQSGNTDRQSGISKQGHRQLRRMLVEISWLALRYNPHLRRYYERICHGSVTRRKIAIVAVARKLAVVSWAMLRDGSRWQWSKACFNAA